MVSIPEPMCACSPPGVLDDHPRVADLGQIDPELHAAARGHHVHVVPRADVRVHAEGDRVREIERQETVDLRHRVHVDHDAPVADGAQVAVGHVRAGEPDVLGRESRAAGDEDLSGGNAIAAEALAVHDAQDRQRAVRLHGVERAEGEGGERAAHPLDLPANDRCVVHVERRVESCGEIGDRDVADVEHSVFEAHWSGDYRVSDDQLPSTTRSPDNAPPTR
jgi:hypothetical protein